MPDQPTLTVRVGPTVLLEEEIGYYFDVPCVVCGRIVRMSFNGGAGEERLCCGRSYRLSPAVWHYEVRTV